MLHAAQHGLQEPKPREDLRRALERVPEDTWADAARLAVALDAQAAFWTGLSMEPAGRELQASLELEKGPSRTETELRASTAPPTAVGLLRLAETPGLGAKLEADLAGGFSVIRVPAYVVATRETRLGRACARSCLAADLDPHPARSRVGRDHAGATGGAGVSGFGDGTPPSVEVESEDRDEVLQRRLGVVNGLAAEGQPRVALAARRLLCARRARDVNRRCRRAGNGT